eukprot:6064939-Prymnesium_polylepis.1
MTDVCTFAHAACSMNTYTPKYRDTESRAPSTQEFRVTPESVRPARGDGSWDGRRVHGGGRPVR